MNIPDKIMSHRLETLSNLISKVSDIIFAILAIIMLKIEVLGHQLLQNRDVHQMRKMNPLLPLLLIDALLLQKLCSHCHIVSDLLR
jgi:hypothetical protein